MANMPLYYYTAEGILYVGGEASEKAVINAAEHSARYLVDNKGEVILLVAESYSAHDQAVDAVNALRSSNSSEIVKVTGAFIFGELISVDKGDRFIFRKKEQRR